MLGLSCSRLLAATHTKTLIGALATRFEAALERRLAAVVGAEPPPLVLDWLGPDYITKDELSQRGYDVLCYP
jgi:hypothetical protein